jgi:hypothetical protein
LELWAARRLESAAAHAILKVKDLLKIQAVVATGTTAVSFRAIAA